MSRLKNRVGVATGVFLSSAAVSGCGNETLSTKENAIKVAETRYAKEFKAASPVGKFTMQYIASVEAIVPKARDFLGDIDAYWITFNNGCMKNKAYDIAGGIVTDNDEVEGRVLATAADAYVDPEHPDMLIVRSGHTASDVSPGAKRSGAGLRGKILFVPAP